ncbi:transglycosylase SLT domain-containing protein [Shewanella intestini]|uniref:Transglycosylase SLT domain-containing protein n=1 Tax=Shewanella intestini TaxID=2017544 RepID=A0ABS5I5P6_9GAMM|nr:MULTISPECIES: transglycosylase SLT domain-containing protein [Shewanella]MBR9729231.1 transglycosylase SLT domain-containing protein [Shewanella intestini]MRG35376.1 transglycosylase SLT domain-containing protein [Shewanella sp. XMDDZSB0408]
MQSLRLRTFFILFVLIASTLVLSGSQTAIATTHHYSIAQQTYLDAREALDNKDMVLYQKLRHKIPDYPLTIYLDYHQQYNQIMNMNGVQANKALAHYRTTALFNTLRYRYLSHVGAKKQWQDFLAVSPSTPNDITLQCYYNRAQIHSGDKNVGYQGAEKLWQYGYSRPKACDPLFKQWTKAGHRTQALIWQRMLLSFNANQSSLLKWLGKKLPQRQAEVDLLIKVYRDPQTLRHTRHFSSQQAVVGDIVNVGLRKLAKRDLQQAAKLYLIYQQKQRFSDYEAKQLNRYIVRRALIKQDSALLAHVDSMLEKIGSDDLYEMRLRWALRDQDMDSVARYLPLLSKQGQNDPRWRYWQARLNLDDNLNKSTTQTLATEQLTMLAQQRNFYGFVAATLSNQAVNMNDNPIVSSASLRQKLYQDPSFARVIELRAIDKLIDARSEWLQLMRRQTDNALKAEYGLYALEHEWYDLSVESSIQAKSWHALALRFPPAQQALFHQASERHQVSEYEITAISRRESAFYPFATSGVGARGMMQLMPATAKHTAKQQKLAYKGTQSLYQPELNIMLGSAYYAKLLAQFNQNRILATAAYNAGPSNVNRWLKRSGGKLDLMSFIETIPFRETREYVQAVISYRLIFQHQHNALQPMFSQQEFNQLY